MGPLGTAVTRDDSDQASTLRYQKGEIRAFETLLAQAGSRSNGCAAALRRRIQRVDPDSCDRRVANDPTFFACDHVDHGVDADTVQQK